MIFFRGRVQPPTRKESNEETNGENQNEDMEKDGEEQSVASASLLETGLEPSFGVVEFKGDVLIRVHVATYQHTM